ncbi:hypothetical protein A2U01_0080499, partial [Trifolium medium]|nr:hypothetical protein [Trifolium medium]
MVKSRLTLELIDKKSKRCLSFSVIKSMFPFLGSMFDVATSCHFFIKGLNVVTLPALS